MTLRLAAALMTLLSAAAPGFGSTTIPLDPRATYLHVCNDPALNSVPISLAGIGIQPGDFVLLEGLGGWDNGPGGDAPRITVAVFSASDVLLSGSERYRVKDALEAGLDFVTADTYRCGTPTDILQDFRVDSTVVIVPPGATHLFATGHDQLFYDNSDPNGDYALRITKLDPVGTALPMAPPALILLPGSPNPFLLATTIRYSVAEPATVFLSIRDARGRIVRTLEESVHREEGTYTVVWDGRDRRGGEISPGVYFAVLESGSSRLTRQVVLIH